VFRFLDILNSGKAKVISTNKDLLLLAKSDAQHVYIGTGKSFGRGRGRSGLGGRRRSGLGGRRRSGLGGRRRLDGLRNTLSKLGRDIGIFLFNLIEGILDSGHASLFPIETVGAILGEARQ
jgi:hypothetical protein